MNTKINPVASLCRLVVYILTKDDADKINRCRYVNPQNLAEAMRIGQWHQGAQAHIGNRVSEGQECAAVIVRVWGDEMVNLKILLDGNDDYWVTSAHLDKNPPTYGTWHWPVQSTGVVGPVTIEHKTIPANPAALPPDSNKVEGQKIVFNPTTQEVDPAKEEELKKVKEELSKLSEKSDQGEFKKGRLIDMKLFEEGRQSAIAGDPLSQISEPDFILGYESVKGNAGNPPAPADPLLDRTKDGIDTGARQEESQPDPQDSSNGAENGDPLDDPKNRVDGGESNS